AFSISLTPLPPTPTPFPYTTLFRSAADSVGSAFATGQHQFDVAAEALGLDDDLRAVLREVKRELVVHFPVAFDDGSFALFTGFRSEEHTSELQSRENLVCRLLLEKK